MVQNEKMSNFLNSFMRFLFVELFLRIFSACYYKVNFRHFNSGSFDVRTDTVLSAIWQLAGFKDTLSKQPCKSLQIHQYFKDNPTLRKLVL